MVKILVTFRNKMCLSFIVIVFIDSSNKMATRITRKMLNNHKHP